MPDWESKEVGRWEVVDCMGRPILIDTMTGWSWTLTGADRGKPQWVPISWPARSEEKP